MGGRKVGRLEGRKEGMVEERGHIMEGRKESRKDNNDGWKDRTGQDRTEGPERKRKVEVLIQ
jgi:hypothetical protein